MARITAEDLVKPIPKHKVKEFLKKQIDDMSPVDRIFQLKFKVSMPAAYLYTDEDFARGVHVTGDRERDARAAQEMETLFMPIVANDKPRPLPSILSYHKQNVPGFTLVHSEDVPRVYQIIVDYLEFQSRNLNENLNLPEAKRMELYNDLEDLNKLAAFIHPNAHATALPKHLNPDSIISRLRLRPKVGIGATERGYGHAPVSSEPQPVPEYKGLDTMLGSQILEKSKRWKQE